jgi:hypothetical protein
MKNVMRNPEYWRARAKQTRFEAGSRKYKQQSQEALQRVAEEYDRLAEYAASLRDREAAGAMAVDLE